MGRLGVADIPAVCGMLGGLPLSVGADRPPGAFILVYLAQLPLFVAGLWLGLGASAVAGVTASRCDPGGERPRHRSAFAGLYAVPVVLLVRQALLARGGAEGGSNGIRRGC